MDSPDDAIDAVSSLVRFEDGLIIAEATGAPSTGESTAATFAAIRDLVGQGPRHPFLFDARRWPGGDASSWATVIRSLESTCSVVALLLDPKSPAPIATFPDVINRLLIPFQVFTDEAEALAFLRGYLTSEQPLLDPPDDAVETATGTVWLRDGIIFDRSNDSSSTGETEAEDFAVYRDLTGGALTPMLWDARKWRGGDLETWTTAFAEMESAFTAVAMIVGPDASVRAGPFNLDRLPIPIQLFTDATEALAFLRGFLPDK